MRLKKKKKRKDEKVEEEESTSFTIYINGKEINKIKQIKVSKDINQIQVIIRFEDHQLKPLELTHRRTSDQVHKR